jgi:O-6-methylguanine DNA methyltransferase
MRVEQALRAAARAETVPEGFAERVLAAAGVGPRLSFAAVETPIGLVYVAWSQAGVRFVSRADSDAEFRRRLGTAGRSAARSDSVPANVLAALRAGRGLGLAYDLSELTEFERAVLSKTLEIPRGEVRTYGWIAREIGRPGAVRAVGSALGHNPVPLLIPCHRVVRSDGLIGQYSMGGPEVKRSLLGGEGVSEGDLARLERLGRSGVRYVGSDTTHVFCLPACSAARRISEPHLVGFRSAGEAESAGYRPCARCRPVGSTAAA